MSEEYVARAEHREFAERIDAENARQNHRIERLENTVDKINQLATATEKLATNMESMLKEQEKQSKQIDKQSQQIALLESAPAKKWDKLVWLIIGGIVTAVISFFAGKLL